MDNQNKIPDEIFVSCASPIDDQLVQNIFKLFSDIIRNNVKTVHLLLHSPGGTVQSGIALYNFLTNIPVNIIMYNGGWVGSSAVLFYLAGKTRKASSNAIFILHKTVHPNTSLAAKDMKRRANDIERDDTNSEAIWEKHIIIPDDKRRILEQGDVVMDVEEAKATGLVHEIADFRVPAGSQLISI
ncbi:MAG: ATP-dependent Clp protease proteolytic subunit [Nitrospirae bacterium]|nr:ATP-dependent Clp protease proteolytic subunit [Nitrospirota bacterium]